MLELRLPLVIQLAVPVYVCVLWCSLNETILYFLQRNHLIKYTGWPLQRRKENDWVNLPHSLPNLWQNRQMRGKQGSWLNKDPSCSVSRGIGAALQWQADWHPVAYCQTPSPALSFFLHPHVPPQETRDMVGSSSSAHAHWQGSCQRCDHGPVPALSS